MFLKLIIFSSVLTVSLSVYQSTSITPCSHGITMGQFGDCILREAGNSHPELEGYNLDLEPLDPLTLGLLIIKTGDFTIKTTNTVMRGLSDMEIVDVGWDFDQNTSYTLLHGNLTLSSDYESYGSFISLPIFNFGKLKVNAYDARVNITYSFKSIVDENGVEHMETFDFKTDQKYGRLVFNMTSQIGNSVFGEAMNNALNENWEELATFGPARVALTIAQKLGHSTNKIFNLVPFDELVKYI